MALIFEILFSVFSMDFGFIASLVMNNIFFVFGFAAIGFIQEGNKNLIKNFIAFTGLLLAVLAITEITGIGFFPGQNTVVFFGFIVMPLFILGKGTRIEKHTRKIIALLIIGLSFAF